MPGKNRRLCLTATLKTGRPFFAAPLIYEPFTKGQIGVLMPKGSEDLLDYVNGFLAKEKESGRLDELAEEYFLKYIEEDEELRPAA